MQNKYVVISRNYKLNKKKVISLLATALLSLMAIFTYWYAWPKVSLFYPEYRVERFRTMSTVFPSEKIDRANFPIEFELGSAQITKEYVYQGKNRSLAEFLQRSGTTGFLVINENKLVYESYFQGYDQYDLATSFSVAKSFVSTLVGIAYDEGKIESLNDPITSYVPSLKKSGYSGVSILDVLTMSSGIDFSEDYDDKSSDVFTIYNDLFLFLQPIDSVIGTYDSKESPGFKFDYASINTQALGMLVESVAGVPLTEYLSKKVLHPLGLTSESSWAKDIHGNVLAFWGLNLTPRDFAKLGILYAQNGVFEGKRILSEEWINLATRAKRAWLKRGQIDNYWGYGYQWWLPEGLNRSDFAAIGIWGQFIYVDPATKTVIVKVSADPRFKIHELEAIEAFRAISKSFSF